MAANSEGEALLTADLHGLHVATTSVSAQMEGAIEAPETTGLLTSDISDQICQEYLALC